MATTPPDDDQLRDALLELEEAGWRALRDGTASAFYAHTMAPNGLMVLANGQVMTRDEVVDALAQSPPWTSSSIEDVRLVRMGVDAGALVYIGRASRDGVDFVGGMSSVYVRDAGGVWRLALYQQTPIPDA